MEAPWAGLWIRVGRRTPATVRAAGQWRRAPTTGEGEDEEPVVALFLFAFWLFTRLVHVFSMPVGYLTMPYIVYRSRDKAGVPA